MLLAASAASAALAIGVPGAYAAVGSDHEDSSYSKEEYSKDENGKEDKDEDSYKDEDKDSYKDEDKGDKDYDKDYDKHDKDYDKKDDYGKEDKDEDKDKDKDKDEDKDKDYDKPSGGVHTGGGALTLLNEDSWGSEKDSKHEDSGYSKDEDSHGYKDKHEDSGYSKDDENKDSWGGGHDKPSGGVHTGGGALAAPTATAGGLAVLALAGAGLYTARRRKSAGSAV
jgi:hypothetical protein